MYAKAETDTNGRMMVLCLMSKATEAASSVPVGEGRAFRRVLAASSRFASPIP